MQIVVAVLLLIVLLAQWKSVAMSQALDTAISELLAEVTESTTKIESITLFIDGVPELVAAAVKDALYDAGVSDDAAVAAVESARQTISDQVDAALSAVEANTASDTPVQPPPAA